MNAEERKLLASEISQMIFDHLEHTSVIATTEGDFSVAQIQRILGVGQSTAYEAKYHGEYHHNGRRLVRREEFLYRRRRGMDVCICKEH